MKKVIKVAGYQGKESVHTRSMDFFINKLSNIFDFEYEKDITLSGKKASSLIESTRDNSIQISYLWSSYYEKLIPEIQLLDLPFYFKNKNDAKALIDNKFNKFVSEKLENNLNLKLLSFWDNGARHISTNKSFIHDELFPKSIRGRCDRGYCNRITLSCRRGEERVLRNWFRRIFTNPRY